MTPREFVQKWQRVELKESAAKHEHFLDLCEVLNHPSPAESDPEGQSFVFEKGVHKRDGRDGFADVWKRGYFAWEYKGRHKNLDKAYQQLDEYRADLENPPLLVTCDFERFEIHTSWTNSPHTIHIVHSNELIFPEKLKYLWCVFNEPERLKPGRISQLITTDAARSFGEIARSLRERGIDPLRAARFLDRMIFCFFAEDIGLLPNEVASKMLESVRMRYIDFPKISAELFAKMAVGGFFGIEVIPFFNGDLFSEAESLELTRPEFDTLRKASLLDWSVIDPAIFGTLFERGLDPKARTPLGAHYTSKEDIETLVEPVVLAPLRREWAEAEALALGLLLNGQKSGVDSSANGNGQKPTPARLKKAREEAWIFIDRFLHRLESVKVLDPACGSGNFLYVTLRKLKDLQAEVYDFILEQGFALPLRLGVGPWQLYGIEINQYAHQLAQMTVWIGHLQWEHEHGRRSWKEPILEAMSNIELKDAIIDLADPQQPRIPEWPRADFIVGNPPFLGDKVMRGELGDSYVDALRRLYEGSIPGQSDLCCYWFERARMALEAGLANRVGLLATQSIRGGANRVVLERIKQTGDIFWAISDRDWILKGANVHVSMIGFDRRLEVERVLDGSFVTTINPNLSFGAAVDRAATLVPSSTISFIGAAIHGPFGIKELIALELLLAPNPNGRPSSDVVRPWLNGHSITRRPGTQWIIDIPPECGESDATLYESVFEILLRTVKPIRLKNRRSSRSKNWWILGDPQKAMRAALVSLEKFAVTPRVSKHRLFAWFSAENLATDAIVAFKIEDDLSFGVLHSRFHEIWSLALGTQLREKESGFRYTPTTCFETFPIPHPTAEVEVAIADAARKLDELRRQWLNPSEWTKEEILEFPGAVDGPWQRFVVDPDARGIGTVRWPRLVARDEASAQALAERTLTNLYNRRPAWLDNAHRQLDEAVAAAYGWPVDLANEQILERLLALNLERAASRPEP